MTDGGTNCVPQEQNGVLEKVPFPFLEGGVLAGRVQE